MLSFFHKYGRNVYSQNGEDGILEECLRRMNLDSVKCVEIGGHDGRYCSNTAYLIEQGASGLFVEADYNLYLKCKDNWKDNPRVRVQCCKVDQPNVNAFVDDSCDVFSTDTDGADFEIFGSLRCRPKIAVVEIDSSLDPTTPLFNDDDAANYNAMVRLGLNMKYFLLCHTGNLIFVRNDFKELFPEAQGDPVKDWPLYFRTDWLKQEAA